MAILLHTSFKPTLSNLTGPNGSLYPHCQASFSILLVPVWSTNTIWPMDSLHLRSFWDLSDSPCAAMIRSSVPFLNFPSFNQVHVSSLLCSSPCLANCPYNGFSFESWILSVVLLALKLAAVSLFSSPSLLSAFNSSSSWLDWHNPLRISSLSLRPSLAHKVVPHSHVDKTLHWWLAIFLFCDLGPEVLVFSVYGLYQVSPLSNSSGQLFQRVVSIFSWFYPSFGHEACR